jgi:hypothetical protein
MMDLNTLRLKLAIKQPGCPVCRLRQEAEERYLFNLLYENVTDGTTQLDLVRGLGLCPHHTWLLQAIEQQNWNDGMGVGILYEDLTARVLDTLSTYLAQNRASHPKMAAGHLFSLKHLGEWLEQQGQVGRWLARRLFRVAIPAAPLLARLSPQQPCRVCEVVDPSEEANLTWLVRKSSVNPEFRTWYAASDGLCLPHLRRALAQAEEMDTVRFLVEVGVNKLTPLLADLKEYGRKHIWQFQWEPKYVWEQASWIRVVAFFAGEAEKEAGEDIYQLRRQALTDYRQRPQEAAKPEPAGLYDPPQG